MSDVRDSTLAQKQQKKKGKFSVSFETLSFLLFCSMTVTAVLVFPGSYLLFVIIAALDGVGTVTNSDTIVGGDRSAFFLLVLVLSVERGVNDILFLFLETVVVIAALDFSFLLRKLRRTVVDRSVFRGRLGSYAFTLAPAFLLSYSLVYVYSFASDLSASAPLVLLALTSTGAMLVIYSTLRFISSRTTRGRE